MKFKPGDLIVDGHDRKGIVFEKIEKPDQDWLDLQNDPRMRTHQDSPWWKICPLTGGSVHVPEPLMRFVRKATPKDLSEATAHANDYGARELEKRFPQLVDSPK